ncbi:MAG: HD domain-containing protein [Ruminococcaceae bacterium]|nr:HD domain-containing protein [Oscillospiraceae bacterium]
MKQFLSVAAVSGNPDWDRLTARYGELYTRDDEVRDEFSRDYTRILHSLAYRRLKHKTQVFYNIENDHICTRMEHVAHVESVSHTIAEKLGLNTELTKAISIGHDLGHAPFGHKGEKIIDELTKKHLGKSFWHEQNGLHFVDDVELLEDKTSSLQNLKLTYAVRDGIISHCGEIDKNCLKPRSEFISLDEFTEPGQYEAVTWEGCVVKFSDKIAYVGRDIEDAKRLNFLDGRGLEKLRSFSKMFDENAINTTVIMHRLIIDTCANSSIEKGICLSDRYADYLKQIKDFNYEYIYNNPRLSYFGEYAALVINSVFRALESAYSGRGTFAELEKMKSFYPSLAGDFADWLNKYIEPDAVPEKYRENAERCKNRKIYSDLSDKKDYIRAVIDYISGMTDGYAIKVYNELISFQ